MKKYLIVALLVLTGCGNQTSSSVTKQSSLSLAPTSSSLVASSSSSESSLVSESVSITTSESQSISSSTSSTSSETILEKEQVIKFESGFSDGYEYDTHLDTLFSYFEGEVFASLNSAYKVFSGGDNDLKLGSKKAEGVIDLKLNDNVVINKVEVLAYNYFNYYSYGEGDSFVEGWSVDNSSLDINGLTSELPYSENAAQEITSLSYELNASESLVISGVNGRVIIKEIKVSYTLNS